MKVFRPLPALCALAALPAFGAGCGSDSGGGPEVEDPQAIHGYVHREGRSDLRLSDVNIRLLREGLVLAETTSELDGSYHLDGIMPGPLTIEAEAAGYDLYRAELEISPGSLLKHDVSLRQAMADVRTGNVIVRVVRSDDDDMVPVPGAVVTVSFNGLAVATEVADASGRARLIDIESGPAELRAGAEGFRSSTRRVRIPAGNNLEIDIVLQPATELDEASIIVQVAVRVLALGGVLQPPNSIARLPLATVFLRNDFGYEQGVLADGDGRMALAGLEAGPYELTVSHESYFTRTVPVYLEPRTRTEAIAILEPLSGIAGTLLGSVFVEVPEVGHIRAPDALLRFFDLEDDSLRAVTRASDLGLYDVRGLTEGQYRIAVEHPAALSSIDSLEVPDDDAALRRDLLLPLSDSPADPPPPDTLNGVVFGRDTEGALMPLADVELRRGNSMGPLLGFSDANGAYRVDFDITEGDRVAFIHPDHYTLQFDVAIRGNSAMYADGVLWEIHDDAPVGLLRGEVGVGPNLIPRSATVRAARLDDPATTVAQSAYVPGASFELELPPGEYVISAESATAYGEIPPVAIQPSCNCFVTIRMDTDGSSAD